MRKVIISFVSIILVLTFCVGIYLYPINQQLPENSFAVFDFGAYFMRLGSVEFPTYNVGSVLAYNFTYDTEMLDENGNPVVYYTYAQLSTLVTMNQNTHNVWVYSPYLAFDGTDLGVAAYWAYMFQDYGHTCTVAYRTYVTVSPPDGGIYNSMGEVIFREGQSNDATFVNRLAYFFGYIGSVLYSAFEFAKYLLPYDCYTVISF